MPQVFQVLRCYKCLAFQVHQVKKSNKWECKLCGEKQSVKRHYGIGTGKECRLHVQKLNEMRGEKTEQNIDSECSDVDDLEQSENNSITNNIVEDIITKRESKWSDYVEKTEETYIPTVDEKNTTLFGKEVVLELPNKRKKLNNNNKRNNNIAVLNKQSEEVFGENDVSNESIVISVSNDAYTTRKKQIKRFVPPTTKTKSKWREYESENMDNQTDDISSSDLSNQTIESNTSSSLTTSTNAKKYHKLNTPTSNVRNRVYDTDKEKYKNYHITLVGETYKQNSKWNDFVDNTECRHEQPKCHSSQDFEYSPHCTTNSSNLFSLCDENDLDSVLDINV